MTGKDGARFKKGDMVRCINADHGCGFLVEGNVYEVYSVRPYEGLTISRTSPMWEESQFEPASQPPAWVEDLAARWEKEARDLRELAARKRWDDEGQMRLLTEAETYEDCAEQLRERAKSL